MSYKLTKGEVRSREREGKNGKIYKNFYLEYRVNGVKKGVYGKTEAEVKMKMQKIEDELRENSKLLDKTKKTVGEYLRQLEEDVVVHNKMQSTTKSTVKASINRLKLAFNDLDIKELSADKIDNYFRFCAFKKKYHTSVIKKDLEHLKKVIKKAKIENKFPQNLDLFQFLNMKDYLINEKKRKSEAIPFNQRKFYLEAFQESHDKVLLNLMYRTAVRFGEAIAITEEDIYQDLDLLNKSGKEVYILNINKQLQYARLYKKEDKNTENFIGYLKKGIENEKKDEQMVFKVLDTKSDKSTRKIIISKDTYSMLKEHIEENEEKIEEVNENNLIKPIFFSKDNGMVYNQYLNEELNILCAKHNLKKIRTHDLRRTAITRYFESGLTMQEVLSIAGHSFKEVSQIYNFVSEHFLKENPERIISCT